MAKNILLIEDNLEVRENTAELLELSNFKVATAVNGKDGVKMAKMNPPDLIICDIMMPELDGYGVLHLLGKDPKTASIPFIFLTAKADRADVRKGMNLGADDYLTKPFDEMELLNAIDIRLQKHERLSQEFANNQSGLDLFLKEAEDIGGFEDLIQNRKQRAFDKKEYVYREGDYANYLFYVQKGKLKSYKTDDYGKEFVTSLYGIGDFIGYFELLKGEEYEESTMALDTTELLVIPRRDFEELIYKNRDVASRFIKMLASNVAEKEEELLRLAFSPVRERAAAALLKLYNKFSVEESEKEIVSVSREDLASLVGTATESVIRTLSDFKSEGLVEIKGRNITLLDIEKLKKLAQI